MKKDEPDIFLLFSRVLLIYPIRKLKELLNEKVGFKIKNTSYLNPVYIEKSGYSLIIKNSIETLNEYHNILRFLFKKKDLINLKKIFEQKGYKDYLPILIEIMKKSVIGLSVITNKKINDEFCIKEIDDPYNLGYIDKFIFFEYDFNIESFPPFTIGLVIHEAFIEFLKESLFTVEITLPYLNVIKFFSVPISKYLNFLFKKKFFFYPEKVEIKENFLFSDEKEDKIFHIKKGKFLIYLSCDANAANFLKFSDYITYLFSFYSDSFNFFIDNKLENSFDEADISVIKDSLIITYRLGLQKEVGSYKLIQIIPTDVFKILYFYFFKKEIFVNIRNLEECLMAFENAKIFNNFLCDFIYREKISLNISEEDFFNERELALKNEGENKIRKIEEIIFVEDRIIQFAVSRMKQNELIVILKNIPEKIRNKIFNNMSERSKIYYLEEIKKEKEVSNIEKKVYISKFINNINSLKEILD